MVIEATPAQLRAVLLSACDLLAQGAAECRAQVRDPEGAALRLAHARKDRAPHLARAAQDVQDNEAWAERARLAGEAAGELRSWAGVARAMPKGDDVVTLTIALPQGHVGTLMDAALRTMCERKRIVVRSGATSTTTPARVSSWEGATVDPQVRMRVSPWGSALAAGRSEAAWQDYSEIRHKLSR